MRGTDTEMDKRDTFTEKLHEKERAEESVYFARRDRRLVEKLRDGTSRSWPICVVRTAGHGCSA